MKSKQIDLVKQFIQSKGEVMTWDVEAFAFGSFRMKADSASRHARKLAEMGFIKHPEGNRHKWVWIEEEPKYKEIGGQYTWL